MVSARSLENLREPFPERNGAAITHGSQVAAWRLEPRVLELADELRPQVPGYQPGDEVLLRTLCLVLARLERANAWLAEQPSIVVGKRGEVLGIVKLVSGWENQVLKLCSALGLSPAARARIGSDSASGNASAALEQYLREREGGAS